MTDGLRSRGAGTGPPPLPSEPTQSPEGGGGACSCNAPASVVVLTVEVVDLQAAPRVAAHRTVQKVVLPLVVVLQPAPPRDRINNDLPRGRDQTAQYVGDRNGSSSGTRGGRPASGRRRDGPDPPHVE